MSKLKRKNGWLMTKHTRARLKTKHILAKSRQFEHKRNQGQYELKTVRKICILKVIEILDNRSRDRQQTDRQVTNKREGICLHEEDNF